jgi:hypothetical protein
VTLFKLTDMNVLLLLMIPVSSVFATEMQQRA